MAWERGGRGGRQFREQLVLLLLPYKALIRTEQGDACSGVGWRAVT